MVNEREQAMMAAQEIQNKLQEMQEQVKEEERRKKEQKMADRMAAQQQVILCLYFGNCNSAVSCF